MSSNLLESLNNEQLEAVTHKDGPLMILAGAGTGKTTVITQRIAWLIEQGLAKPDEILALTFTEKAATEMEERVDHLLPIGYVDLWISTFHAFCERVLRTHALEIGLPNQFTLLTEVDTFLLVRRHFDEFELEYYKPRGNPTRFIRALLQHFSRIKDETITQDDYDRFVASLQADINATEGLSEEDKDVVELAKRQEIAKAYRRYQQLLLQNNMLDFADLVSYTLELLRTRPNILHQYQEQFKYILVDEFQDTNFAQYELVKLLTKAPHNITVVGDDDQSIYKFRGASLSNIMLFREDFPDVKRVVLTTNYRSKVDILDASYQLIQQNNPHRLEVREDLNKQLSAHHDGAGIVEHIHCGTLQEEVQSVIQKIADLKESTDCAWHDMAILVRANATAEPFIQAFNQLRIPYRFLALSGLYQKPILLDAMAYMRVLDQPHDSPSLYRLLSHPELGISVTDLHELTLFTKRKGCSLYKALQIDAGLSKEGAERVKEILQSIDTLSTIAKRKPTSELFVEVMKETGLLANVRQQPEAQQQETFGFLNQFFTRIKKFEIGVDDKTLHHFLEEFEYERQAGETGELSTDIESGPDVINIMTVHASKGLEFRYVFLVNLVEQRFPSQRRSDPIDIPEALSKQPMEENKDAHVQEERRLFYVAMTRAKEGLFLYSADDYGGTRKRKPSRFLQELDINAKAPQTGDAFSTPDVHQREPKQTLYELPKSISFTQIAAFTSCPLQYKFAHILRVPVFGRYQMSFGKTMHNTLQHFLEPIVEIGQLQSSLFDAPENEPKEKPLPDLKALLHEYDQQWIDEWYPDQNVKTEYYQKGIESLTEYHAMLRKDRPVVAYLEKGFTLRLGTVTVKGRIDRIDRLEDGFEIVDYKTGKPKTLNNMTWQDKRQLVLYALAGQRCFDPPLPVKSVVFHYLEDNSMVRFEPTQSDCERLEQEILDSVEKIRHSDFAPTPGFQCQYCDFKDICEFSKF